MLPCSQLKCSRGASASISFSDGHAIAELPARAAYEYNQRATRRNSGAGCVSGTWVLAIRLKADRTPAIDIAPGRVPISREGWP
jgi:hypothetical protein